MLRPSEIVGERYRLDALLGVGSFGYVFRAHDTFDESTVALKLLRTTGHSALRRFKREFRRCSQLLHPNLVRLYGLSHDPAGWLLAMEFVDGCTADRACRKPGAELLGLQTSRNSGANPELLSRDLGEAGILRPHSPLGPRTETLPASAIIDRANDARAEPASVARSRLKLVDGKLVMAAAPSGPSVQHLETAWTGVGDHRSAIEREREARELDGLIEAFGGITGGPEISIEVGGVVEQLIAGIAAIHAGGLIHGDIKPANVLVRREGTVKILDFGLASVVHAGGVASGRIAGTVRYMAPELASAGQSSPASDWYAFGATVAELFFGWEAIDDVEKREGPLTLAEVVRRLIGDQCPSDTQVDPELGRLIVGCLAEAPAARFEALRSSAWLSKVRSRGAEQAWSVDIARPGTVAESDRVNGSGEVQARPWVQVPMFGRERELEVLRQAWAARDCGQLVLLEGEPGSGKSHLCSSAMSEIRTKDHVVLHLSCLPGDAIPLAMFDALLEAIGEVLEENRNLRRRLRQSVHWAELVRSFNVFAGLDSHARKRPLLAPGRSHSETAIRAFSGLLGELADLSGVAICIDDIHWADPESAAPFATMIDLLRGRPLLFVATRRTELIGSDFLPRLERDVAVRGSDLARESIRIGKLVPEAATAMLQSGFSAEGDRDSDALLARAITEVRRVNGAQPWALIQWIFALRRGIEIGLPESGGLEALLRRRFEELSNLEQAILRYVACSGQGLELIRLRRLMGGTPALEGSVADLIAQELVERRTQGGHVVLACRHPLINEIVCEKLEANAEEARTIRRELAVAFACPATKSRRRELARSVEQMRGGYRRVVVRDVARRLAGVLFHRERFKEAARLLEVAASASDGEIGHMRDRLTQAKANIAAGQFNQLQSIVDAVCESNVDIVSRPSFADDLRAREELILLYVKCLIPTTNSLVAVGHARELCLRAGLPWPDSPGACIAGFFQSAARVGLRLVGGLPVGADPDSPQTRTPEWREQVLSQFTVAFGTSDLMRSIFFSIYSVRIARPETNARIIARALAGTVYAIDQFRLPFLGMFRRHMAEVRRLYDDPMVQADLHFGDALIYYLQLNVAEGMAAAQRSQVAYRQAGPQARLEQYFADVTVLHLLEFAGDYPRLHVEACRLAFAARGMADTGVVIWARIYMAHAAFASDHIRSVERCLAEFRYALEGQIYSPSHFGMFRLSVSVELVAGRVMSAWRLLEQGWVELDASHMLTAPVAAVHGYCLRASVAFAVVARIERRGADGLPGVLRFRKRMLRIIDECVRKIARIRRPLAQGRKEILQSVAKRIHGQHDAACRGLIKARSHFEEAGVPLWVEIAQLVHATWSGDKEGSLRATSKMRALGIANPRRYTELHLPGVLSQF